MSTGDKAGAIKAAFVALDHLAKLRERHEQQARNLQAIAQLVAPDNPSTFLRSLKQLHAGGLSPEKAARYLLGIEGLGERFRQAIQQNFEAATPEPKPAFLRTRAETAQQIAPSGSATEPGRRPLARGLTQER